MDREDPLVCKVHLVLKVFRVPWVSREIQDPLGHLVHLAQEVCQVFLEKTEKEGVMVNLDLWGLLDHLAKEVFLVCLAFQDLKVIVASLVLMVQKAVLVPLEKREKKGLQDLLVHMDPWALLVRGEKEEEKGHLVLLA